MNNNCVYNIRYTDTTDIEEAKKVLIDGDIDLQMLLYTFGNQLITGLTFINCVAAPNVEISSDINLILTKNDFSSDSKLQDRLKALYHESFSNESSVEESCKMTNLISVIIGYLATESLSIILNDKQGQDKFLWLNLSQWKAVMDERYWKFICGGYGSGKTLVARSIIKRIKINAKIATDVYYMIFDRDSIMIKNMELFSEALERDCKQKYEVEVSLIFGNLDTFKKLLADDFRKYAAKICPHQVISFSVFLIY